jgi:PAS domain S-box-containing protein
LQSKYTINETLDTMRDGFFAVDRAWRFTYLNRRAADILKKNPEELMGKAIWEECPEIKGSDIERACRRVMETEIVQRVTIEAAGEKWYETIIYPANEGISFYLLDVSEQKRMKIVLNGNGAETVLRESRRRLEDELSGARLLLKLCRNAECTLKESDRICRTLFDNNQDGFALIKIIYDEKGKPADSIILKINRAFELQTGLKGSEIVGKRTKEYAPIFEQEWLELQDQVVKSGETRNFETYRKEVNKWYDVFMFPCAVDTLGELFRDITEKKRIEKNLEESEQLYRTLFENTDEGFILFEPVFNESGRCIDLIPLKANKAYHQHTGITMEEALAKPVSVLMPCLEQTWLDIYGNVVKTGKPIRFESYNHNTNRWFDVHAFPFKPEQAGVFFSDISKRKRAEKKLQQEEERKAFLLKLCDLLRRLANPAEIQGEAARLLAEFLHADRAYFAEISCDECYGLIRSDYVRYGGPHVTGLYKLEDFGSSVELTRNGPLAISDISKSVLLTSQEKEAYAAAGVRAIVYAGLFRDGKRVAHFVVNQPSPRKWTSFEISLVEETAERTWTATRYARVLAELYESQKHSLALVKHLRQTDRNKNEFLNALSHELRNPLATIAAGLSLLDLSDDKDKIHEAKEIMRRQIDQLCRLVDELLDLTRINNNKVKLKKEQLELTDFVASVANDFKALFDQKGIVLETEIFDKPIYLEADPVRLTQIIGNLLHNAFKFTPEGGKTVLKTAAEKNEAVITVLDNGIGIDPGSIKDIFDPLMQAGRSSDESKEGLGLGLSIVREIAQLHGGSVNANSEGPGMGSAFTIRLPIGIKERKEPGNTANI